MWDTLGIKPTTDIKEIKSAYAKLAKQYNPEEHPDEFQKIFDAYKSACSYAKKHYKSPKTDISNESKSSSTATGFSDINEKLDFSAINSYKRTEPQEQQNNDEFDFSEIDTSNKHANQERTPDEPEFVFSEIKHRKSETPLQDKEETLDFSGVDTSRRHSIPEEKSAEDELIFQEISDTQNDTFDFSKVNDKYDEFDEKRRIITLRIDLTNRLRRLAYSGTFNEWNSFFDHTHFTELANDYEFRIEASKILNGRPLNKDIAQLITKKFTNSSAVAMNYAMGIYQVFIPVKNQPVVTPTKKPSVFLITLVIVILAFMLIPVLITLTDSAVNYSTSSSPDVTPEPSNDLITLRPYKEGEDLNEYLLDAMFEISDSTAFDPESLYRLCIGKWNFDFGYIEFFEDNTFRSSFFEKEITGSVTYVSAKTGPELTITFSAPNTVMDNTTSYVKFLYKDGKAMSYKHQDGIVAIGHYTDNS